MNLSLYLDSDLNRLSQVLLKYRPFLFGIADTKRVRKSALSCLSQWSSLAKQNLKLREKATNHSLRLSNLQRWTASGYMALNSVIYNIGILKYFMVELFLD